MKRPRLTAAEISAVLAAAQAADVGAVFDDYADEAEGDRAFEAYERGISKLKVMLASRQQPHLSERG